MRNPTIYMRLERNNPENDRLSASIISRGRKAATTVRDILSEHFRLLDTRLSHLNVSTEVAQQLVDALGGTSVPAHTYDISPYLPPSLRAKIPTDEPLLALALVDAAHRIADGYLTIEEAFPSTRFTPTNV